MSKRRLPYMPLWVEDYHRDTRHLSTEEHGAYLLLLMAAWEAPSNSLPDDDQTLSGLAKVAPARWAKMKIRVMALWSLDGRSKMWVQKRLKKERRLAVDRKQKASDAAATRWNNEKKGDAKAMLGQCHPSITTNKKPNGFSSGASAPKKSTRQTILEAFSDA